MAKTRKTTRVVHRAKKEKPQSRRFPLMVKLGTSLFVFGAFFMASYLIMQLTQKPFCANSITCISNLSVQVDNGAVGTFEGHKIMPPPINLADDLVSSAVLGASTSGEKHVYVDLSTQKLFAYEGTNQIFHTFISSGKWHVTPPGDYRIWIKLRATRMAGGSGADAYDLPNVPYTMFFYNSQVPKSAGFSLHGAYWHDNFGHPMSHGCVNMRSVDAKVIYDWADPQTTGYTTYASSENPGTIVSICNTFDEATQNCVEN